MFQEFKLANQLKKDETDSAEAASTKDEYEKKEEPAAAADETKEAEKKEEPAAAADETKEAEKKEEAPATDAMKEAE